MYMKQGTQLAELISLTSLIIWDEVPMNHRYAFEAVDKSLEDILSIGDPSLKILHLEERLYTSWRRLQTNTACFKWEKTRY